MDWLVVHEQVRQAPGFVLVVSANKQEGTLIDSHDSHCLPALDLLVDDPKVAVIGCLDLFIGISEA